MQRIIVVIIFVACLIGSVGTCEASWQFWKSAVQPSSEISAKARPAQAERASFDYVYVVELGSSATHDVMRDAVTDLHFDVIRAPVAGADEGGEGDPDSDIMRRHWDRTGMTDARKEADKKKADAEAKKEEAKQEEAKKEEAKKEDAKKTDEKDEEEADDDDDDEEKEEIVGRCPMCKPYEILVRSNVESVLDSLRAGEMPGRTGLVVEITSSARARLGIGEGIWSDYKVLVKEEMSKGEMIRVLVK